MDQPMSISTPTTAAVKATRFRLRWFNVNLLLIVAILALMALGLLLPLGSLLIKSLQNQQGHWIGLSNYAEYLSTPSLSYSVLNSLQIGVMVTVLVISLAFTYALALQRTCMPGKKFFKTIAYLPILTPSLLPALALVYLFGKQGYANSLLFGHSIYGPIGIVLGLTFWGFPHALMLITTGLRNIDARMYESAQVLRIGKIKTFFLVTIANSKYGLISAAIVIFTLVICDFGVAKIIGGSFNVLATDIYKQVVGQQNFSMGAVTSAVLLLPAVISFAIDQRIRSKQQQMISTNSVPYQPKPNTFRDTIAFVICSMIAVAILTVLGTALYASFVSFWPYNKELTFTHYNFEMNSVYGWAPFVNSLKLSFWVAIIGTILTFVAAYNIEKVKTFPVLSKLIHLTAMLPMAVPGMALGLGYIFFFNQGQNSPLQLMYGTMAILVLNTVTHLYTVGHLTSLTALKQLPNEIESVAKSLKISTLKTFFKITVPVCTPALLDIFIYLFMNAMTTTSAVVFLYSPDTIVASISVLNMADTGQTASASAMAVMIMLVAGAIKGAHLVAEKYLLNKTQQWRAGWLG
nr:putative 2-aminoethylphosphonate ABC transporter permease subunit [uncultured Vibrio sp.]